MRLWIIIILVLVVLLVVLGYRASYHGTPVQGQRIVSLSPATTEILFELGLGEQVVGASDYSDYPSQAKKIPTVGSYNDPNTELILQLKPDLVVGQMLSADKSRQLQEKVGANCKLLLLKVDSLNEIMDATLGIAQAAGKAEQGRELVSRWRQITERLKERYGNLPQRDRVRVFVEVGANPLQTAGPGSYMSELIQLAGGQNVGDAAVGLWPVISSEMVIKWDPQVILLLGMQRSENFRQEISSRLGWEGIEAVKARRIIELGDSYKRQGPRLFEHAAKLADIIHNQD